MGIHSRHTAAVAGVAVGAGIGIGLGAAVYIGVAPILEQASGALRELQGPLWNLVPFGAMAGGWLGLRAADAWHRAHEHGSGMTLAH